MSKTDFGADSLQSHNNSVFYIGALMSIIGLPIALFLLVSIIERFGLRDLFPIPSGSFYISIGSLILFLLCGASVSVIVIIQQQVFSRVQILTQSKIRITGVKMWIFFVFNILVTIMVVMLGFFITGGIAAILY